MPQTRYTPDFTDIVATMLCAFGLFFVGMAAITIVGGKPSETGTGMQVSVIRVTALETLSILGAVYLMILRRRGIGMRDLGFDPVDRVWLTRAVLIGLALIPIIGWVVGGIQSFFEREPFTRQSAMLAPEGFSWLGAGAILLYTGILVPFAEELFFRGLLYRWLKSRWNMATATLVSSLMFGLAHVHLEAVAASFIVGMVLAFVYERSRSLWTPVILHMVFNSASLFMMFALTALKGG